jgi:hypothetical protein
MSTIITVPGTNGRQLASPWWVSEAPLMVFFGAQRGVVQAYPDDPFDWSTDLDGEFLGDTHSDWQAGGDALRYYLRGMALGCRNVVTHSHGLQVALYAAAKGCRIDSLVTICGPVRHDMEPVVRLARPHIGLWVHVHSDQSDPIQIAGSLFDGGFLPRRDEPLADRNDSVPGVGHSGLLYEPAYFHHWIDRGWLDALCAVPTAP